jgi:transposase
MSEITTIGLDLSKHVFQVHGIDAEGATVLRKRLRRGQVLAFFSRIPPCLVGLEACAVGRQRNAPPVIDGTGGSMPATAK